MSKFFFFIKRALKDIVSPNRFGVSREFLDASEDFSYSLDYTTHGMVHSYNMKFDNDGIIMMSHYIDDINAGSHYHSPVKIAHYALAAYNDYRKSLNSKYLDEFNKHVNWLKSNVSKLSMDHYGTCVVWKTPSTNPKYNLQINYVSAIVQGLVISALSRAYMLNNDIQALSLAKEAIKILEVPVEKGGLLANSAWGPMYEEYPALPYSHVVNGFMFCLMGLYDLNAVSLDKKAKALFDAGINTLISVIPAWLTTNWSKYDLWDLTNNKEVNLATRHYQLLHVDQLRILFYMSKETKLLSTADKLEQQSKNILSGIGIYYNKFRKLILKK